MLTFSCFRFENLVRHLREHNTILTTKRFLQRLHLFADHVCKRGVLRGELAVVPVAVNLVNVRVFLAVNMVCYFPGHVFERMDQAEREVESSAQALLAAFTRVTNHILETGELLGCGPNLCSQFLTSLYAYTRNFQLWKNLQARALPIRIENAIFLLIQHECEHLALGNYETASESRASIDRLWERLVELSNRESLTEFENKVYMYYELAREESLIRSAKVLKGAAYQELHEERKAMDVLLKLHVQILRIKDALQRCMDALSVFPQDPVRSAAIYRQISRLQTRLERVTGLVDALEA
jgi:hypothetical protein